MLTIAIVVAVLIAACVLTFRSEGSHRLVGVSFTVIAALISMSAILGLSSYWGCHDANHPAFFTPLMATAQLVKGGIGDYSLGGRTCPSPTPVGLEAGTDRGVVGDLHRFGRCRGRRVPVPGGPAAGQPRRFRHRHRGYRRRHPIDDQRGRADVGPAQHSGRHHQRRRRPRAAGPQARRPGGAGGLQHSVHPGVATAVAPPRLGSI